MSTSPKWPPTRDTILQQAAMSFTTQLVAAPLMYGTTVLEASNVANLAQTYTNALSTALDPTSRTRGTIAAKDTAKEALLDGLRLITKKIQGTATVTEQMKRDLGIPVRGNPSPIDTPDSAPLVNVMGSSALTMKIRLSDAAAPSKRGKPAGVQGAEIFSYVPPAGATDPTPPLDLEQWRFEGLATKTEFAIAYNPADAGKTATVVARWYNPRGEAGPVSNPITGNIAA